MKTPCQTEDDCPTPMWCRGKDHCPKRDAAESGLRPLAKGDTVQRGDIFIDGGQRFEMDTRGILLGVRCLGQIIRKDKGGWYRPQNSAS